MESDSGTVKTVPYDVTGQASRYEVIEECVNAIVHIYGKAQPVFLSCAREEIIPFIAHIR